jgi:hypothetical protein
VTGKIAGNVFIGDHAIAGSLRGWAIETGNVKSATISNNIISGDNQQTDRRHSSRRHHGVENQWEATGINNLTIEDNIVNKWYAGLEVSGWLVREAPAGPLTTT